MTFFEFFEVYWWLMFPVFGMAMAFIRMSQSERRTNQTMDLIKSYIDQGKEPPAELLRLAAKGLEGDDQSSAPPQTRRQRMLWQFVVFGGMAAGFGTAYALTSRTEDWAWVFLAVAVSAGVIAMGALIMFALGDRN